MPASHFRASAIGICIYVWLHMAGLKWHLITPLVKRKSWLLKKNQILHEKKTMNYDFRVHTLFHKDFSMVLFEDKIIEKPYGVFIYTSYGCSTSCCLWNIPNVIFLVWNLETEKICSEKIPFSWNICRGKHRHQCLVCVSLLSTKGLLSKNSESFINPEIYTCNILPSLV